MKKNTLKNFEFIQVELDLVYGGRKPSYNGSGDYVDYYTRTENPDCLISTDQVVCGAGAYITEYFY
mgnify:CR=1 FL=1